MAAAYRRYSNIGKKLAMQHLIAATVFGLAVFAEAVRADADCTENWICINSVRGDDKIVLHAENLSDVPLTFTLKVNTRHLVSDNSSRITETLAARESRPVTVLRRTDETQKGKYWFSYDWTIGNKDAVHDEGTLYRLPYEIGKVYRVLQGFGSRFSHTGVEQYAVDFKMVEGTPVHAARAGVVARTVARHAVGCWNDGCGRYANYIVIVHDDETTGEYYHLQKNGVLVREGDFVTAGQQIGFSGNTGNSALPHLHFGVYRAIDRGREQSIPFRFLSADGIVERPRRGGLYEAAPLDEHSRRASLDGAAHTSSVQ